MTKSPWGANPAGDRTRLTVSAASHFSENPFLLYTKIYDNKFMESAIIIKKANTGDIGLINDIASEVFPVTYSEVLTPGQIDYMMDWMYSPASLRRQMEEEGHIYYIAYADARAVGYVSIQQEGPDLFHLQKIYVLPGYQKYKLGRRLFEHAVATIRELHPLPCVMELNVNRNNPAIGFYEHMGMEKVREGDFDIGNGYYMNDYIMALRLE